MTAVTSDLRIASLAADWMEIFHGDAAAPPRDGPKYALISFASTVPVSVIPIKRPYRSRMRCSVPSGFRSSSCSHRNFASCSTLGETVIMVTQIKTSLDSSISSGLNVP